VLYEGKPLRGVTVRVDSHEFQPKTVFRGVTSAKGSVRTKSLPPGDYDVFAEYLGVSTMESFLRVLPRPTKAAHRDLTMNWGPESPGAADQIEASNVAGRVFEVSSPKDGQPAKVRAVTLVLRSVPSGTMVALQTAVNGHFAFEGVSEGLYVLSVQGRTRMINPRRTGRIS